MNGVQTRLKCKPNVKQCKRLVFPARSALFNHNILNTKAISHFQANHILIRFVFPPLECGRSPYHPKMMLKVILYAYMNNIYSCRKIEKLLHRDIHYIWLAGYEKPDFITINRFRNRVKKEINEVFTQTVVLLSSKGFISLNVEYIDGTKIESKANKYTFVWRKTVERNRERLMKKIHVLLGQIDDVIAREKSSENNEEVGFTPAMLAEMAGELRHALEQVSEPSAKEEKTELKKKHKQLKELEEHRDKLQEYD